MNPPHKIFTVNLLIKKFIKKDGVRQKSKTLRSMTRRSGKQ